jgi:hypothetical protein
MSSTSPVGGCVFHFFVKNPLTGLVHCRDAGDRHYAEAPKRRIITAFGGILNGKKKIYTFPDI